MSITSPPEMGGPTSIARIRTIRRSDGFRQDIQIPSFSFPKLFEKAHFPPDIVHGPLNRNPRKEITDLPLLQQFLQQNKWLSQDAVAGRFVLPGWQISIGYGHFRCLIVRPCGLHQGTSVYARKHTIKFVVNHASTRDHEIFPAKVP